MLVRRGIMTDPTLLGPWVRRFLLEHLVGERNLARNTQRSYRDALVLLLPFIADYVHKSVDQLQIDDITAEHVRLFLHDLEQRRQCSVTTRNQRLPRSMRWCASLGNGVRSILHGADNSGRFRSKRRLRLRSPIWKKRRWTRYSMRRTVALHKGGETMGSCCFFTIQAPALMKPRNSGFGPCGLVRDRSGSSPPLSSGARATNGAVVLSGPTRQASLSRGSRDGSQLSASFSTVVADRSP